MGFFIDNESYNTITESDLYSINEQMFQNNKLNEVELIFGKLRSKYNSKTHEIHTDPLVRRVSEIMEDVFGFNSFQLFIDQSRFRNAYTFPLSSKIDAWNYKKCVIKNSNGIRFTKEAKANIVAHITTELFFDRSFKERELVAILLHEIGHNFSDSLDGSLGIFSNFRKVLLIPSMVIDIKGSSNALTGHITKFNDKMRKENPDLVVSFNLATKLIGGFYYAELNVARILSLINPVANFTNQFNAIINNIIFNPVNTVIAKFMGMMIKKDEYISDSFATMYGYGYDISSALLKLNNRNNYFVDDIIKQTKFGKFYYQIFIEITDFMVESFIDVHPCTGNRILNILNQLEKEYNKEGINPKTKKALKEEIDEIKKLINKEVKSKSFEGNKWRILWNRYILSKSKTPNDKTLTKLLDKIDSME